jgi:addiction module HigA family antidote
MAPAHRVSSHPGQVLLKEFLQPLGLTQVKLAKAISIPQNRVHELIRGKRGITPETALLLAEYFSNSAEFRMNLQTAHDLTRCALNNRNDLWQPREIAPDRRVGACLGPGLSLPQLRSRPHRPR